MFELMQLLIGISIRRYLPAKGTAGLALILVRGYSLVPAPPPKIIARTRFMPPRRTALRCKLTGPWKLGSQFDQGPGKSAATQNATELVNYTDPQMKVPGQTTAQPFATPAASQVALEGHASASRGHEGSC